MIPRHVLDQIRVSLGRQGAETAHAGDGAAVWVRPPLSPGLGKEEGVPHCLIRLVRSQLEVRYPFGQG
jgi:hypothetical protein